MTSATSDPAPSSVLRVSSPQHRVEIVAETRSDIAIDGSAEIDRSGNVVTVDATGRLDIRVPTGTDVHVGTDTARVEIDGNVGVASVLTRTGRVGIGAAETVDVRTESGRVEVELAAGDVCIRSTSGRVSVGTCGSADLATETGQIEVSEAHGDVRAHCTSGRIEVELAEAADVTAESVTGRVAVRLPAGTRVFRSDNESTPRPAEYDCTVVARSVSGRIIVSS